MKNVFFALVVLGGLGIGIIFLQVFLSKKQNKWLGLILPAISFIFSLLPVMSIAVFNTYKTTTQTMDEYGRVINDAIRSTAGAGSGDIVSTIFLIIAVFLLYNISTLILLAIYWGCREKIKKNKELEKMSVQDLG